MLCDFYVLNYVYYLYSKMQRRDPLVFSILAPSGTMPRSVSGVRTFERGPCHERFAFVETSPSAPNRLSLRPAEALFSFLFVISCRREQSYSFIDGSGETLGATDEDARIICGTARLHGSANRSKSVTKPS